MAELRPLLESNRVEEQLAGLAVLARRQDLAGNSEIFSLARRALLRVLRSQSVIDEGAGNDFVSIGETVVNVLAASVHSDASAVIEEQFVPVLASVFATEQSSVKFEALSLLLHALESAVKSSALSGAPSNVLSADVVRNIRVGLFDVLRGGKSGEQQSVWPALRCFALVTAALKSLDWACSRPKQQQQQQKTTASSANDNNKKRVVDDENFFLFVVGLVGVEFSVSFDAPRTAEGSQMLMTCVEILELIMRNLTEDLELRPDQVLQLRDKLNDICRVALEFLLVAGTESAALLNFQAEDVRALAAARIVATWIFNDPEAIKEKEVTLLVPVAISALPWFADALSEHWLSCDDVRTAFLQQGGVVQLSRLLIENALPTAQAVGSGNWGKVVWDKVFHVDPFDACISVCSSLQQCCSSVKQFPGTGGWKESSQLISVLTQAVKLLLDAHTDDAATLISFFCAALAQIARLVKSGVEDAYLRLKLARCLAVYLPVALESDAVSTVKAVAESVRSGDYFGIKAVMLEVYSEQEVKQYLR